MASFSTLPTGWLPWTANTLTVAVLGAATWLSAVQRPEGVHPSSMTVAARAQAPANQASKKQATAGAATTTLLVRASATEPTLPRLQGDGLLPVSYQAPATTAR